MEINLSKLKNAEIFFIGFAVGFIPEWRKLDEAEEHLQHVEGDVLVIRKILRKAKSVFQPEKATDIGVADFLGDIDDINHAIASESLSATCIAVKSLQRYSSEHPAFKMGKFFANHYPISSGRTEYPKVAPPCIFFKWYFDEFKILYVEQDEDTSFVEKNLDPWGRISIGNILLFTDKIMDLLNSTPLRKYMLHYELSKTKSEEVNKKTPVQISIKDVGFTPEPIGYDSFIRLIVLCLASNKCKGIKREQEGDREDKTKLKICTVENDIELTDIFPSRNSVRDTINLLDKIPEFHKDGRFISGKHLGNEYSLYRIDGIEFDEKELVPFVRELVAKCKLSAGRKFIKIPPQLLR
jgi:hypothetical protein